MHHLCRCARVPQGIHFSPIPAAIRAHREHFWIRVSSCGLWKVEQSSPSSPSIVLNVACEGWGWFGAGLFSVAVFGSERLCMENGLVSSLFCSPGAGVVLIFNSPFSAPGTGYVQRSFRMCKCLNSLFQSPLRLSLSFNRL